MKRKRRKPVFDPKAFLAKADGGRTISKYQRDQTVFSQWRMLFSISRREG
jgi:hypothetical protein